MVASNDPGAACGSAHDPLAPLVVDWTPAERAALSESMKKGLAVFAYDCHGLQVLAGCSVDGAYGYHAEKADEVLDFTASEELAVNVPSTGELLARDLKGELAKGSVLHLALRAVGKTRSTVHQAPRAALRGGAACQRATHFLRGVTRGAFAATLGPRGGATTAASIFQAVGKLPKLGDGDPEACLDLRPQTDAPPAECASFSRLELVPLDGPEAPASGSPAPRAEEPACPQGFVRTPGKCSLPASTETHQCRAGDAKDCQEQCSRGDAPSCWLLGLMNDEGRSVARDEQNANQLYKRSCDGGYGPGCSALGRKLTVANDPSAGAAAALKGCNRGDALGCYYTGVAALTGAGVMKDPGRATSLLKQACDGGVPAACARLGLAFLDGNGVGQSEATSTRLFERACDGGDPDGCAEVARSFEKGRGYAVDRANAARFYQRACDLAGPYWMVCDEKGCRTGSMWTCDAARKLTP